MTIVIKVCGSLGHMKTSYVTKNREDIYQKRYNRKVPTLLCEEKGDKDGESWSMPGSARNSMRFLKTRAT
jgi:hypothetical protein